MENKEDKISHGMGGGGRLEITAIYSQLPMTRAIKGN